MTQLVSGLAAIRSLDAIRRHANHRRSVGSKAWQARNPAAVQPRTVGHAKVRRTGQVDQYGRPYDVQSEGAANLIPPSSVPVGIMPNRSLPFMCSGRERLVSKTVTMGASSSATASLTTPGAFCPKWMYISQFEGDINEIVVTSIKSGLEEQIISGEVPAAYFTPANPCCPVACFPCMCLPSVPLDITVENTANASASVTIGLVGDYYRVCPPNADQMVNDLRAACGNAKLIGFASSISDGATVNFELETPGKFCPSNLFVIMGSTVDNVFLSGADVGLEDTIIGDGFPIAPFSNVNEGCCLPFCVECLCMPGVALNLSFTQGTGPGTQTIEGVVAGAYTPAC